MNTPQAQGEKIVIFARRQGIRSRIQRAIRSSQVLCFCLQLAEAGQIDKFRALDEALALELNVDSVRIGRTRGLMTVEIALPTSAFVALPLSALQRGQALSMPLGRSVLAEQVEFDLASNMTPQVLIAGTTGSGKGVLLQNMIVQLARQNTPDQLRLLLIDGKAESLRPFARLPHLIHPVIIEPSEAVAALSWAVAELDRRKLQPQPWRLVVVIDEIAEIIMLTGGENGQAAECLRRLAALGRSLGVHVIAATQHPTREVLGGTLAKANLPARLAGRVLDANASTLATGMAGLGAHKLRGAGDFLAVWGGDARRLQVAVPSEREMVELARTSLERIPRLELDVTIDGALAATANAANSVPDPLTPAQVAWVLSNAVGGVPGLSKIRRGLAVGEKKARRLQEFANELLAELSNVGCEVMCTTTVCNDNEADADETGDESLLAEEQ